MSLNFDNTETGIKLNEGLTTLGSSLGADQSCRI